MEQIVLLHEAKDRIFSALEELEKDISAVCAVNKADDRCCCDELFREYKSILFAEILGTHDCVLYLDQSELSEEYSKITDKVSSIEEYAKDRFELDEHSYQIISQIAYRMQRDGRARIAPKELSDMIDTFSDFDMKNLDALTSASRYFDRNRDGDYSFGHPALQTLFACECAINGLKEGKRVFGEMFDDIDVENLPGIWELLKLILGREETSFLIDSLREESEQTVVWPSVVKGAIVTELHERKEELEGLDLSEIYLKGGIFEGASFEHAILRQVWIREVSFNRTNFSYAKIDGGKWIRNDLQGADFTGAVLYGVDLSGHQMRGTILIGTSLTNTKFVRTHLQGADLEGADFTNCNLSGAKMQGVNLKNASFNSTNLERANLSGANKDSHPDNEAVIDKGTKFRGANLKQADLKGAVLNEALLEEADLRKADLRGSELRYAKLSGAVLTGAKLQGADLRGASFENSTLLGAVLARARNWEKADFKGARLDSSTKLPKGFENCFSIKDVEGEQYVF